MKTSALLAIITAAGLTSASAATISFSFTNAAQALGSAEEAGAAPYRAANWNNLQTDFSANSAGQDIFDSTGNQVGDIHTSTGLQVTYDSNTIYFTDAPVSTSDDKLFKNYLDDGALDSGQPYITLQNIENADQGYSVIVYLASDSANSGNNAQLGEYWIQDQQADAGATILTNGGTKNTPILLGDSYTGTYTEASGTTAGNYLLYTGLTAEDITIRANKDGGRSSIAGFQIVTVPEPSSTALLGLGTLALILRRKR